MSKPADYDGADIIVCQGPPRCALSGDDAVKAQRDGCVWCRRIYVAPDGIEYETQPGEG